MSIFKFFMTLAVTTFTMGATNADFLRSQLQCSSNTPPDFKASVYQSFGKLRFHVPDANSISIELPIESKHPGVWQASIQDNIEITLNDTKKSSQNNQVPSQEFIFKIKDRNIVANIGLSYKTYCKISIGNHVGNDVVYGRRAFSS